MKSTPKETSALDWICEQITYQARQPDEFTTNEAAQRAYEKTGKMPSISGIRNRLHEMKRNGLLESRPFSLGGIAVTLWRKSKP